MKKKSIIICSTIVIILIIAIIALVAITKNSNKSEYNNTENNNIDNTDNNMNINVVDNIYTEVDKNQISYQDDATIEDLKKDYGKTGDSSIYEIQTEYDGRKTLNVKDDVRYQVAFSGMIKKSAPTYSELDEICSNNEPKQNGIWIEVNSRDKLKEYFNNTNIFKSKYEIDENGYLKITESIEQNENDKKIEGKINGDQKYILSVSSECYIVDDITGEILNYSFEDMDKYQTYDYFKSQDKMIIFLTENKEGQLAPEDIMQSVLDLI